MKNNNAEYRRLIVANKNYIAKRLGMFGNPKVSRVKDNTITITDRLQTATMNIVINPSTYDITVYKNNSSEINVSPDSLGSYSQYHDGTNPNNILNAIEYSLKIYA